MTEDTRECTAEDSMGMESASDDLNSKSASELAELESETTAREKYYESIRTKIQNITEKNSQLRSDIVASDAIVDELEKAIAKIRVVTAATTDGAKALS